MRLKKSDKWKESKRSKSKRSFLSHRVLVLECFVIVGMKTLGFDSWWKIRMLICVDYFDDLDIRLVIIIIIS